MYVTYRVVGVEDVRGRGVVHDDDLVQVAPQPAQVLHVVPPVEDARLPEQATAEGPPLVKEVWHGVGVLERTARKEGVKWGGGRRPLSFIYIYIQGI